MKKRDYRDFLQDILEALNDAESFVDNLSFEEFAADRKTIYAVVRSVEIIGEATKNIPDQIKAQTPDLPWKRMAAMRDKLIHGYFGVDIKTLYKTAKQDLPTLKIPIQKIIEHEKQ